MVLSALADTPRVLLGRREQFVNGLRAHRIRLGSPKPCRELHAERLHLGTVVEIAGRIAGLDRIQLEKLVLEMVTADWRALRSLCFALGLEWDDDFD